MPKARFSEHAHEYDTYARVQQKNAAQLVNKALEHSKSPQKVCDIGCGTGTLGELLQERLPQVNLACCDISEEMLNIAKKKLNNPNFQYQQCSLPEENDFDMIISNFSFQWYDDITKVLTKCMAKLAPNGILAISFPIIGTFPKLQEAADTIDIKSFLPSYYNESLLSNFSKKSQFILSEVSEVEDIFPDTLSFLRELHLTGATLEGSNLSTGNLRKLIRIHDNYFTDSIKVKYRIWTAIYKKEQ
jgi:malonyl-CoA O-methyltransferase